MTSETKEEERLLRALTKGKLSSANLHTSIGNSAGGRPPSRPPSRSPSTTSVSPNADSELLEDLQVKKKSLHTTMKNARDLLEDLLSSLSELKSRERELQTTWEERNRSLAHLSAELQTLGVEVKVTVPNSHQNNNSRRISIGGSDVSLSNHNRGHNNNNVQGSVHNSVHDSVNNSVQGNN
jgi:chromosome condensin MukBEF ATPase and DNA-binding subunit MukB